MKTRAPVPLSEADKARVRSWLIHEDSQLLAFNKPAGLSSQGGGRGVITLDDLLWAFARSNGKRPELVHRLDRDTSGVILAARTKPAAGFLGKAIQARKVTKRYLALVSPLPAAEQGVITLALRREEIGREAWSRVCEPDHPDAQASESRYRVLARGADRALVALEPLTGRMHQLRVHMAALGTPILGDVRYGGALAVAGGAVPRLMLHAASLTFPHPEGGHLTLEAAPPPDFQALAEGLDALG